jgi:hypothetical protein
MLLPFNINVNVNGIPCLRSTAVNVTTTEVRFDFNDHRNIGRPFVGLVVVQLAQAIPAGTTATLPIVFTSQGGNPTPVVGLDDEPITVASITGTGVYHLFYDQRADRLQLLSPYIV